MLAKISRFEPVLNGHLSIVDAYWFSPLNVHYRGFFTFSNNVQLHVPICRRVNMNAGVKRREYSELRWCCRRNVTTFRRFWAKFGRQNCYRRKSTPYFRTIKSIKLGLNAIYSIFPTQTQINQNSGTFGTRVWLKAKLGAQNLGGEVATSHGPILVDPQM